MRAKKRKPVVIYIGGSEWSVAEVPLVEKFRRGRSRKDQTLYGLADYGTNSIYVRKGIGQARYEVFFHEGLHAVCHENRQNDALSDLRDDEHAVELLSKFMVSYLRQMRDKFYK